MHKMATVKSNEAMQTQNPQTLPFVNNEYPSVQTLKLISMFAHLNS